MPKVEKEDEICVDENEMQSPIRKDMMMSGLMAEECGGILNESADVCNTTTGSDSIVKPFEESDEEELARPLNLNASAEMEEKLIVKEREQEDEKVLHFEYDERQQVPEYEELKEGNGEDNQTEIKAEDAKDVRNQIQENVTAGLVDENNNLVIL